MSVAGSQDQQEVFFSPVCVGKVLTIDGGCGHA